MKKYSSSIYLLLLFITINSITKAQIKANLPAATRESKAAVKSKTVQPRTVYIEKAATTQVVKFISNADAVLYVDGEKKADLKADVVYRMSLTKGNYAVKLVSAQNADDELKETMFVTETGSEQLCERDLQKVIQTRKAQEAAARRTQEIRKQEDEEAEHQKQMRAEQLQHPETAIAILNEAAKRFPAKVLGEYQHDDGYRLVEKNASLHENVVGLSVNNPENKCWFTLSGTNLLIHSRGKLKDPYKNKWNKIAGFDLKIELATCVLTLYSSGKHFLTGPAKAGSVNRRGRKAAGTIFSFLTARDYARYDAGLSFTGEDASVPASAAITDPVSTDAGSGFRLLDYFDYQNPAFISEGYEGKIVNAFNVLLERFRPSGCNSQ